MQHNPGNALAASITVTGATGRQNSTTARRLRDASPLHISARGVPASKAASVPSLLQAGEHPATVWPQLAAAPPHLTVRASAPQVYTMYPPTLMTDPATAQSTCTWLLLAPCGCGCCGRSCRSHHHGCGQGSASSMTARSRYAATEDPTCSMSRGSDAHPLSWPRCSTIAGLLAIQFLRRTS
jgi:hypothetical protein